MKYRFVDYPSLLDEIRKRPQLWIGGKERSINLLSSFVAGIGVAEEFYQIPIESRMSGFDWKIFEGWVTSQFNTKRLSLNSLALAS